MIDLIDLTYVFRNFKISTVRSILTVSYVGVNLNVKIETFSAKISVNISEMLGIFGFEHNLLIFQSTIIGKNRILQKKAKNLNTYTKL